MKTPPESSERADGPVSGDYRRNIPALKEIIEERKEKAVESLSVSFARNRLPLEEYERLVEYINKIESERELAIVEKIVAEHGKSGAPHSEKTGYAEANAGDNNGPDYSDHSPGHLHAGVNLALLSSRAVSGPLARSGSLFVSLLGSQRIKIRKADLGKGRTDIEVAVILGDCVIFVEPGIRVTNKAVPVLGSAWVDPKTAKQAEAEGPELFISGAALLGNITVKTLKD